MNLSQIVAESLTHLGYGNDEQAVDDYILKFTSYVNEAVRLIAEKYRKTKTETVTLDANFKFADTVLERDVMRILYIEDSVGEISFYQKPPRSGIYLCDTAETSVSVSYEYYPVILEDRVDVPDLPEHLHGMIHYYVTARSRTGNDMETQSNAAADYQLFNSYLNKIPDASANDSKSATIKNWY